MKLIGRYCQGSANSPHYPAQLSYISLGGVVGNIGNIGAVWYGALLFTAALLIRPAEGH